MSIWKSSTSSFDTRSWGSHCPLYSTRQIPLPNHTHAGGMKNVPGRRLVSCQADSADRFIRICSAFILPFWNQPAGFGMRRSVLLVQFNVSCGWGRAPAALRVRGSAARRARAVRGRRASSWRWRGGARGRRRRGAARAGRRRRPRPPCPRWPRGLVDYWLSSQ